MNWILKNLDYVLTFLYTMVATFMLGLIYSCGTTSPIHTGIFTFIPFLGGAIYKYIEESTSKQLKISLVVAIGSLLTSLFVAWLHYLG